MAKQVSRIHPWTIETMAVQDWTDLVHAADDAFAEVLHLGRLTTYRAPITAGDVVFVSVNRRGKLSIVGGMVVGAVTDDETVARAIVKDWWGVEKNLYPAAVHLIAAHGEISHVDLSRPPLTLDVIGRLRLRRFDSNRLDHWRQVTVKQGRVDRQTIRTLCELDPSSGRLLAESINWTPPATTKAPR